MKKLTKFWIFLIMLAILNASYDVMSVALIFLIVGGVMHVIDVWGEEDGY